MSRTVAAMDTEARLILSGFMAVLLFDTEGNRGVGAVLTGNYGIAENRSRAWISAEWLVRMPR